MRSVSREPFEPFRSTGAMLGATSASKTHPVALSSSSLVSSTPQLAPVSGNEMSSHYNLNVNQSAFHLVHSMGLMPELGFKSAPALHTGVSSTSKYPIVLVFLFYSKINSIIDL